ncbi:hypothetical protein G6F22_016551 [Rhizopus arrhizus]|nr:hypothetical protein G6F22_016551 [Rhizopus arrhizus]
MNIAVINVVAATANVPTQPLPCPANRALGRAATSRAANAIITATTRAVSHGAACANTTRKIWPTSSNCTTVRTAAHNTCRCRFSRSAKEIAAHSNTRQDAITRSSACNSITSITAPVCPLPSASADAPDAAPARGYASPSGSPRRRPDSVASPPRPARSPPGPGPPSARPAAARAAPAPVRAPSPVAGVRRWKARAPRRPACRRAGPAPASRPGLARGR